MPGTEIVLAPVQRVDTFPRCAEVRGCWYTSSGRKRCGLAVRCQECKFVKVCTRGRGCSWVERCKWGPYKPALKTN